MVAIECEVTPEQAFDRVERLLNDPFGKSRPKVYMDDMAQIVRLNNEGLSLKEISVMYGVSNSTICKKLKKWRES